MSGLAVHGVVPPVISGNVAIRGPRPWADVRAHGAAGDARFVLDAAMTAASAVLTSATAAFTASDVGKALMITYAGTGSPVTSLVSTIASYQSATQVTLAAAAGSTVSGQYMLFGRDDTAAFVSAVALLATAGGTLYASPGRYIVTSTIVVGNPWTHLVGAGHAAYGSTAYGPAATTIFAIGAGFTNNAVFALSTDTGVTTALANASYLLGNTVRDIEFRNGNDPNQNTPTLYPLVGVVAGSAGTVIERCGFFNFVNGVRTIAAYTDRLHVRDSAFAHGRNSGTQGSPTGNYQVTLISEGDSLIVDGCTFDGAYAGINAVYGAVSLGARISGNIKGSMYFYSCSGLTVSNYHAEAEAVLRFRDCKNIAVRDSYFQRNTSTTASIILDRSANTAEEPGQMATLDGLDFHHIGVAATNIPDVQVHSTYTVHVRGCVRRWARSSGNFFESPHMGIRLIDENSNLVTAWNAHSAILSQQGTYLRGEVPCYMAQQEISTNFVQGGSASLNGPTWTIATATYWYWIDVYYDTVRLLGAISSGSGASSIAVTNGAAGVLLSLDATYHKTGYVLRVWRALSGGGPFTHYVDVPSLGISYLFDNGTTLSGLTWVATTSSNQLPNRQAIFNAVPRGSQADRQTFFASVIPTGGIWAVGDVVFNSTVVSGGTWGWICTTAGTGHVGSTGNTTNASTSVTSVTNPTTWAPGDAITGTGIPGGTTVSAVDYSTNVITLSANATATNTGILFSGAVFKAMGTAA